MTNTPSTTRKFLAPETYADLCPECRRTLAAVTYLFESGEMPDTDDNEAPIMHMGDTGMFCGGNACKHEGRTEQCSDNHEWHDDAAAHPDCPLCHVTASKAEVL